MHEAPVASFAMMDFGREITGWLPVAERRECLGSVAEIFDGDPPFAPNGCPAQAWSAAAVLRAWTALRGGDA